MKPKVGVGAFHRQGGFWRCSYDFRQGDLELITATKLAAKFSRAPACALLQHAAHVLRVPEPAAFRDLVNRECRIRKKFLDPRDSGFNQNVMDRPLHGLSK